MKLILFAALIFGLMACSRSGDSSEIPIETSQSAAPKEITVESLIGEWLSPNGVLFILPNGNLQFSSNNAICSYAEDVWNPILKRYQKQPRTKQCSCGWLGSALKIELIESPRYRFSYYVSNVTRSMDTPTSSFCEYVMTPINSREVTYNGKTIYFLDTTFTKR